MRQTSRAVALLLASGSVNAAASDPIPNFPLATPLGLAYSLNAFNPSSSAEGAPTNALQLNSRTSGYLNNSSTYVSSSQGSTPAWTAATTQKAQAVSLATDTIISVAGASGCMQCINGLGVWCSRTYSYISSTTGFQYQTINKLSQLSTNIVMDSEVKMAAGAAFDSGSCCETALNFSAYVGTKAVPTAVRPVNNKTDSIKAIGLPFVMGSCVAAASLAYVTTGSAGDQAFGLTNLETTHAIYTSWWCSNGLYKNVVTGGSVVRINSQQIIPQAVNKRQELAQVGCPNQAAMCGYAAGTIVTDLDTVASNTLTLTIPATGGPTVNDKCTWVAWSKKSGPSFTLLNVAAQGIVGTNWMLHAMEYTATTTYTTGANPSGGLQWTTSQAGMISNAVALQETNFVPLFNMPADQFATLRTWYGKGEMTLDNISGVISAWLSPGSAPILNTAAASTSLGSVQSQLYGNVANVGTSNYVNNKDQLAVGNFNYGTYNSIPFDLRQVRYFPAQVAQTVWAAGDALKTKYDTELTSYNLAKTNWDAYVAILDKNAKQDAFAAMFSPPKAPTVPPLPNSPWLPATYTGYSRATAQEVAGYKMNTVASSTASPTAGKFWNSLAAAQTVGGWGSFTAQTLTFRNGWGKSFGTIGYSGDASKLAMSAVWNYKWTCAAGAAKDSAISTTSPCDQTYSTAVAGTAATTNAATGTNAIMMISVVSLWSTANIAPSSIPAVWVWGTSLNMFALKWNQGAWSSTLVALVPIAAPTAAVAAKSLSGIAGAQALAASTAAALAVAAALY